MPGYEDELAQIVAQLNRAAPASRPVRQEAAQTTASLDQLVAYATRRGASDVLLIAGAPVILRVNGALTPVSGPSLSAEDTRSLLLPLLSAAQSEELHRNKSIDLCFTRDGIGRFRGNVHYQRGTLAGSIRLLPEKIPTLESLNMPSTLKRLAEARQGLVLVTGPTGCGKSSTLAALVDLINTQRRCHIVTIEDPVEFVHTNRNSIIEQIEIGHDAPDFATSVRSILRQTPDVILVGEMRDPETMATVLTAAETGHSGAFHLAHQRRVAGDLAHPRFVPGGQPAADPAAGFASLCWPSSPSNWRRPLMKAPAIRRSRFWWRRTQCAI